MSKYDFTTPPKVRGHTQIMMTLYVEPAFKQALYEFAQRQTSISGIKVSMGNVVQTALKQRYPELGKRIIELKKEVKHEKKSIDGIKATR